MQIEALFTPEQRAHRRRPAQARPPGSAAPAPPIPCALKAVSPQVAPIPLFRRGPPTGEDPWWSSAPPHGYSTPVTWPPPPLAHRGAASSAWTRCPRKLRRPGAICAGPALDHLVECHTGEGGSLYRSPPRARVDFVFVDFGLHAFGPMFPPSAKPDGVTPGAFLFVDGWSKVEQWDEDPDWAAFKRGAGRGSRLPDPHPAPGKVPSCRGEAVLRIMAKQGKNKDIAAQYVPGGGAYIASVTHSFHLNQDFHYLVKMPFSVKYLDFFTKIYIFIN